jgi:putative oxidoreductase
MKNFLFNTQPSSASLLAARITMAAILFPHGAQKLLGWFGGYGFTGTMNFFTDVKHIPYPIALLVIIIEFFGSFALLLGAGTRLVALAIIADMTGIIFSSHTEYGFFINWFGNQQGEGFEYHLLFIGLAVVLLISGGGKYSADTWIGGKLQQSKQGVHS